MATLSVQIESGDLLRPAGGRQEPVKKADRKVRPPGDVRAPGHDHYAEYSSFVDQ